MKTMIAAIAIAMLLAATIVGQTKPNFQQSQKQNSIALKRYEWKSRTQIQKDGETKNEQLALMSYDAEGNLQKTLIASSPEPNLPEHGLRGLIAKNKKKDFMRKIEDLRSLATAYRELTPDKFEGFLASAKVTPEEKLVRMQGYNVLQAGDSMIMWFDPVSRRQRRVEIQTALDEKPVQIISEFQDIAQGGPTFMARNLLNYAGTSLVIITQNFDYTLSKSNETAVRNR